ncbi:unnamed protein product, partial [Musa textilis]
MHNVLSNIRFTNVLQRKPETFQMSTSRLIDPFHQECKEMIHLWILFKKFVDWIKFERIKRKNTLIKM